MARPPASRADHRRQVPGVLHRRTLPVRRAPGPDTSKEIHIYATKSRGVRANDRPGQAVRRQAARHPRRHAAAAPTGEPVNRRRHPVRHEPGRTGKAARGKSSSRPAPARGKVRRGAANLSGSPFGRRRPESGVRAPAFGYSVFGCSAFGRSVFDGSAAGRPVSGCPRVRVPQPERRAARRHKSAGMNLPYESSGMNEVQITRSRSHSSERGSRAAGCTTEPPARRNPGGHRAAHSRSTGTAGPPEGRYQAGSPGRATGRGHRAEPLARTTEAGHEVGYRSGIQGRGMRGGTAPRRPPPPRRARRTPSSALRGAGHAPARTLRTPRDERPVPRECHPACYTHDIWPGPDRLADFPVGWETVSRLLPVGSSTSPVNQYSTRYYV